MRTGSYFNIGTTHTVCEDYALHGGGYVILSDGCSNGGGPRIHTDWGSRLLCKAAEVNLDLLPCESEAFNNRCISSAMTQVNAIPNLPMQCLTATLLVAVVKGDQIHVHVVGDGLFGVKKKDGTFEISEIHFGTVDNPISAPYYLRYELHKADRAEYLERFGPIYTEKLWVGDLKNPEFQTIQHNLMDGTTIFRSYDIDEVEFAFIASDGLSSFYLPTVTGTSKVNQPVEVPDVVSVLMDFKSYNADFVGRQSEWVFKTKRPGSFGRLDWHNGDDVSLGVIYCGD